MSYVAEKMGAATKSPDTAAPKVPTAQGSKRAAGSSCGGLVRRQGNELPPFERSALAGSGLNDPGPVFGGDVAPVAPLANRDAAFANIGGHRFCVALPDGVDGCEM